MHRHATKWVSVLLGMRPEHTGSRPGVQGHTRQWEFEAGGLHETLSVGGEEAPSQEPEFVSIWIQWKATL